MIAMFFVQRAPAYLVLGIFLMAAGTVFFEFAGVNYNAMLVQVSTPRTIGKVSGFGWGMGYVGGIVAASSLRRRARGWPVGGCRPTTGSPTA